MDWALFVEGWNKSNQSDSVEAPTLEEFQELKKKYG